MIYAAVRHQWRREFGRRTHAVVRLRFAVPNRLQRTRCRSGNVVGTEDIGRGRIVGIGITGDIAKRFVGPEDGIRRAVRGQRQDPARHATGRRGSPRRRCRAARNRVRTEAATGFRKNAHRIVFAVHEEQVIEVDARAMDVRCAAAIDVADRERIGRGDLIQIVEQRRVTVPWLVLERGDERIGGDLRP